MRRDQLRPVQVRLVAELKDSEGVVIVLGMGGGKTAVTLTAIADLLAAGMIRAAIVVAPKRVALTTWATEAAQWDHLRHLKVNVLSGPTARREKLLRDRADVYTCGIENVVWLLDTLKAMPGHPAHDVLVLDEVSRFKNPRGSRAKALNKRSATFGAIWGLTGTPRPNDWQELWMPLQIISKARAWGMTFDPWRETYFRATDYHRRDWVVREDGLAVILQVARDWMVTVPRSEVVDVPYVSGPGFDVVYDLADDARRDADKMEKDLLVRLGVGLADINPRDDRYVVALSEAVASGKLSQIMQGFLYDDGEVAKMYDPGKIDALLDWLQDVDEPCIICYWYAEDLDRLQSVPGLRVLGGGQSDRDTAKTIEDWNAGRIQRLALHPASAGHGLNLQHGGSRMIWYAVPWSPELYAQTVKRLARPGQKNPVFVHHLVANHPYERLRMDRVRLKMEGEQDFITQLEEI